VRIGRSENCGSLIILFFLNVEDGGKPEL